jgi:hypothetical protein
MTAWVTILVVVIGPAVTSVMGNMIYYRWRKRENVPDDLRKEIVDLVKQVVVLRGQVKYIEGRLNGKHWRTE